MREWGKVELRRGIKIKKKELENIFKCMKL